MDYRIGADIGGTFTDIVLLGQDGRVVIQKHLTTPAPEVAVVAGVQAALGAAAATGSRVQHVLHGTTLFTNALLERKGAKTALVTTRGFRDAVEIGREHRFDMYDLAMARPAPIAPRALRFEVAERLGPQGEVIEPLDRRQLGEIIDRLQAAGVEAVAVCLLHSYANDANERAIGQALAEALPDATVTLSCDLVPELREYERTSTALVNVYVKPIAARYLGRLAEGLAGLGVAGELLVMQSNGGLAEVATAVEAPVRLIESGPAAGALAAAHYGRSLGVENLLSFDMGGTTAKACLIQGGEPLIAPQFEVDRQYRFKRGSGLPVKVPVIEMIEIGTGGGSIAWYDELGRLRIGPESAGADPGPACYGRGGTSPTVTDADLVLGYLDPGFFLGGAMALDGTAAERAIATLATPAGVDVATMAWRIHTLANETMASAARIHAVERGVDITRLPVFAFGGAGPVHALGVARILKCPRVIYPLGAGVMSAMGFLAAPMTFDGVHTLPQPLEAADWSAINRTLETLEARGRAVLGRSLAKDQLQVEYRADMRYRRQGFELSVPLPEPPLTADRQGEIRRRFEAVYQAIYGQIAADAPLDVVSWRVTVKGPRPELALPTLAGWEVAPRRNRVSRRRAHRLHGDGFAELPVFDRYTLQAGAVLTGPAIVEERESTVVVAAATRIAVDAHHNLLVDVPLP